MADSCRRLTNQVLSRKGARSLHSSCTMLPDRQIFHQNRDLTGHKLLIPNTRL
jgi:hypothetical protein